MHSLLFILYLFAVLLLPGYVLLKRSSKIQELEAIALAPVVSTIVYGLVFYPLHVLFGVNVNLGTMLVVLAASAFCAVLWDTKPDKRGMPPALLAIFALALLMRLVLVQFEPVPRVGDSYWHFLLAKSFFGNDWFSMYSIDNFWTNQGFPYHPSYRPPLYNFLLSLAMLPAQTYKSAQLVGVFFGAILVLPTYLLSKRFLDQKYSLTAAALTALNPWILDRSLFVIPYVLVVYFTLLLLHFYAKKGAWTSWLYLGAVAGAGYLVHPTFQISLAAVAVLGWIEYRSRLFNKNLLCLALVFLVIVSPWLVRNQLLFGNPLYTPTRQMLFAGDLEDYERLTPPQPEELFSRGAASFVLAKGGEVLNTFVLVAGPLKELLFGGVLDLGDVYDRLFINGGCYNNALFCILTPAMFLLMFLGLGIASRLRNITVVYLGVGLAVSIFLFGYNNPGGDVQFIPAIIPLGTAVGCLYLEKKVGGREKLVLPAIFLLFAAYSAYLFYENHFGRSFDYPGALKLDKSGVMVYLRETDPAAVIMSKYAVPITYYTGRPTVVLPKGTAEDIAIAIERYNVSFLVIRETDADKLAVLKSRYVEAFDRDGWLVYYAKSGDGRKWEI